MLKWYSSIYLFFSLFRFNYILISYLFLNNATSESHAQHICINWKDITIIYVHDLFQNWDIQTFIIFNMIIYFSFADNIV